MGKLLSLDISSVRTGWAIFDDFKLGDVGIISINKNLNVQERLLYFKKNLEVILLIYLPNIVVVEETYLKNVPTLKTLMQFTAITNIVVFELLHLPLHFVSPNKVRSYYKLKDKKAVFDYIKNKYKAKFKKYTFEDGNDMTDAVLQGLYWLKEGTKT